MRLSTFPIWVALAAFSHSGCAWISDGDYDVRVGGLPPGPGGDDTGDGDTDTPGDLPDKYNVTVSMSYELDGGEVGTPPPLLKGTCNGEAFLITIDAEANFTGSGRCTPSGILPGPWDVTVTGNVDGPTLTDDSKIVVDARAEDLANSPGYTFPLRGTAAASFDATFSGMGTGGPIDGGFRLTITNGLLVGNPAP